MITSLLLGNKTKTLLIGGAVLTGLILLASASSGNESQPALNGTKKPKASNKRTSKGTSKKSVTIKV